IESFVPVEEGRPAGNHLGAENRPVDRRPRPGKDHLAKFARAVFFSVLVVAEPSPAGDGADNLLADKTGANLNRYAHNHGPVGRNQPSKVLQNLRTDIIRAMFEHFHAKDEAETTVVIWTCQILGQNEGQIR